MMIAPARDVAMFDLELIEIDADVGETMDGEYFLRAMNANPRRFGLSRFWVLGAYELVRTIERQLRPAPGEQSSDIHVAAVELKRRFERLRIPLAKYEPARRHPEDWPVAYPDLNKATALVGWWVAPEQFVSRRELADALLDFLESLVAHHRRKSPSS